MRSTRVDLHFCLACCFFCPGEEHDHGDLMDNKFIDIVTNFVQRVDLHPSVINSVTVLPLGVMRLLGMPLREKHQLFGYACTGKSNSEMAEAVSVAIGVYWKSWHSSSCSLARSLVKSGISQ